MNGSILSICDLYANDHTKLNRGLSLIHPIIDNAIRLKGWQQCHFQNNAYYKETSVACVSSYLAVAVQVSQSTSLTS